MNTLTNNTFRYLVLAVAAAMLFAAPLALVRADSGDDIGFWGFDDYGGGGWYTDYATPYYDYMDYGNDYGGWYTDYATPYYDYMDYGSGYGSGFPMSYGSGFGGGFPFTFGGGSSMPSFTNTNVNQNQNTCTAGSCNTSTAINAPTTIAYPPQQPVYYPQQPVYQPPVYQQPIYQPTYQQPVRTPYVSLSAVPYTGLELGPVGTALYWGFLVLWCLIAAYLIAVKKVHYKIAAWFAGSKAATASTHAPVRHSETKVEHKASRVPASQLAGIDPFIASQINR